MEGQPGQIPAGQVHGGNAGGTARAVADLVNRLKGRITAEAGPETVVALLGVGALFGLARVSSVVFDC